MWRELEVPQGVVRRISLQRQIEELFQRARVTGQDGAYLSELLLSKNYLVHGIKRRSSQLNTGRIDHL